MAFNDEIAQVFTEMASLMELTGASVFRINAHQNTARALRDLPGDVREIATTKKALTDIDGIGSGNADRILEYINNGSVADHAALLKNIEDAQATVARHERVLQELVSNQGRLRSNLRPRRSANADGQGQPGDGV